MEIYQIKNLSFAYPTSSYNALNDVSVSINGGEFVTLCGKSGCGKTTLLRLLKPPISPHGNSSGSIMYCGSPIGSVDDRTQAAEIAFVMQNPDNQIVTDKVWHELAFGLESLGLDTARIRTRVSETASFFGIQNWFYKKTTELSGGQKQLLNLASAMVMQPKVLILDEPTSQLDPIAAHEFLQTVRRINSELGTTVILSEHRLEDAVPLSDRVIVMENGRIIADGAPQRVAEKLKDDGNDMFDAMPVPMRVFGALGTGREYPLNIRDGKKFLEEYAANRRLDANLIPKDTATAESTAAIEIKNAFFRYDKNLPDVIKGLNVTVNKGEIFAIVGGNGTGKSTALSLAAGLNRPQRGNVFINGINISKIDKLYDGLIGVLPQNPQYLFAKKSVYADMLSVGGKGSDEEVRRVAKECQIEQLLDSHPYDLSGGEQQRAALAMILLKKPKIFIMDEPTKGMDAHFKKDFANILKKLKSDGKTVLIVSHDIEFCSEFADRCAMFFDGCITAEGTPREFFCGNSYYTTGANRMARTVLPNVMLASDIIAAAGGEPLRHPKPPQPEQEAKNGSPSVSLYAKERKKGFSKNTITSALLTLLAVSLTILFGIYKLNDRKYYFISLVIILEIMVPFVMNFEKRGGNQARKIVAVSVLCALAVAGRAAFYMLPEFKPVLAIVIISAVCLGGETGFLVGAMTDFVSNFFFGQGPWTPWQMFAFGSVGLIAGIIFESGALPKTKLPLSVFGFISALVIYGSIMNMASVLMMTPKPTPGAVISAFAMGLPFDLIHAAASAFFLWLISEPMIEKLERVKIKYGFF